MASSQINANVITSFVGEGYIGTNFDNMGKYLHKYNSYVIY